MGKGKVVNLQAELANKYRLRQAQRVLDLFTEAHGYPARTDQELSAWLETPEGKARLAPHLDQRGNII